MTILFRYSSGPGNLFKRALELAQLPVYAAIAPHSNPRISQIVPVLVVLWTTSGCLFRALHSFWITRKIRSSSSGPHCCATVAGSFTMAPQYRSGDPDVDAFEENTADQRAAPYDLRRPVRPDLYLKNSVPLFLSDPDGEPDSSEYIAPLQKKPKSSLSSRILAGVCAAAAAVVLVALFSSDAARNTVVNVEASMAAVPPAPSSAAQSDLKQLTALVRQKDPARQSGPENQAPGVRGVTTASVAPGREEINNAYQSALQDRAPAPVTPAPVAVADTMPGQAIHHLDPDVIASLLGRADALIANGDVAAARLALRRAADAGDPRAALMLGGTYDPALLESLSVHGIMPDVAMARSWYERAKKLGSAEAPQRLEMLASKGQ
jgi:hypothetical protein